MAITEVVRLEIQTQQAKQNMDSLTATINEQKLITIELERELKRLEQALRDTPKNALAAQRDLNQQINHVKDSISDQRLSLKELQVQQSQTKDIDRYSGKQKKLSENLKITSEETTGLNAITGGYASQIRNLQLMLGFAQKKSVLFAGSLKAVKTALVATGIGALVVAIGLIVGYWDEIVDFITQAEKKQQLYNESLKNTKSLLETQLTLVDKEIELAEELGESTEEQRIKKTEILLAQQEINKQLLKGLETQLQQEKSTGNQAGFWESIWITMKGAVSTSLVTQHIAEKATSSVERQKEIEEQINKLKGENLDIDLSVLKIERDKNKEKRKGLDLGKLLENQSKKELAERQKLLEEIEIIENQYFDKFKEKEELEIQAVREKYFRLIELAKQHGQDTTLLEKAQTEEIEKIKKDAEQIRLDNLKEFREQFEEFGEPSIDQLREQAISELELLETTEEEKREALAQINEYYDKLDQQRKDEQAEIDKKRDEMLFQQKLALAGNFFGAIGQLLGEQSRVGKAFAIAQALINTYQGISNVWAEKAESGLVGAGLIQRIATTAIVAAQGFATVKNIAKVKTPGGGGGGGGAEASGSNARPPSFNMIGDRGGVSDVNSGIDGQNQQPPRAYVVGGDVTTQQELDRNAVNASGF